MKEFTVVAIYEDDYGCEECGPGQEPQVIVVLWDDAGMEQVIRQADGWLYAQNINEGDRVTLVDGTLYCNNL